MGILHAIGNMRHHVQLSALRFLCFVLFSSDKLISVCMLGFVLAAPGSYLDKFFNKTKTKTPEEIAQYLEEDDEVICLDQVGVVRSRTGFSCVIADE